MAFWLFLKDWILPLFITLTVFLVVYCHHELSVREKSVKIQIKALSYVASVLSGLLFFFVLLLSFLSFLTTDLSKLQALDNFESNFKTINHHPLSKLISRHKLLGNFGGTGNHCDYFVGEVRKIKGNHKEILDFYAGIYLPYAETSGEIPDRVKNTVSIVMIHSPASLEDTQVPSEFRTLSSWGIDGKLEMDVDEKYYLIYSMDAPNSRGNHWDCG